MTSPKVAIIGASSKSAIHLTNLLKSSNLQVLTFSSTPKIGMDLTYDLNSPSHNVFTSEFDVAVYFSWLTDRSLKSQEQSFSAATKFAYDARDKGIKVIFISSLAALPAYIKSYYGFYKCESEIVMKNQGHSIIRPATVVSEHDRGFSSSVEQLSRLHGYSRVMAIFSKKLYVPIVDADYLSKAIFQMILNPQQSELNLIESVENFETIAEIPLVSFRLPISWTFISRIKNRGQILDRLLTLITVSEWINENQIRT
jgi:dTDP-4-dehydrorhamnose reductase